jgi:hypothetical protein
MTGFSPDQVMRMWASWYAYRAGHRCDDCSTKQAGRHMFQVADPPMVGTAGGITGIRIPCMAAKCGPRVLFCMPNRTKCILFASVMRPPSHCVPLLDGSSD